MKEYIFLEENEYFSTKRDFAEHSVYVFRKKCADGGTEFGSIQVPKTVNGEWDFYFSKKEITNWFQEIMDVSKEKAEHLFRIKKIVEGKVSKA